MFYFCFLVYINIFKRRTLWTIKKKINILKYNISEYINTCFNTEKNIMKLSNSESKMFYYGFFHGFTQFFQNYQIGLNQNTVLPWNYEKLSVGGVLFNKAFSKSYLNFVKCLRTHFFIQHRRCLPLNYHGKQRSSKFSTPLTLSWRRLLSYRNQSIDLQSKSVDWFLYDNGLRHERLKARRFFSLIQKYFCLFYHVFIHFSGLKFYK